MMLQFLLVLGILLGIVTVLGHAMWLLIGAVFRAMFRDPDNVHALAEAETEAFRRVVLRLRDSGKLDAAETRRMLELADPQAMPQRPQPTPVFPAELVTPPPVAHPSVAARPTVPSTTPVPGGESVVRQSRRQQENATASQPHPLDQIDALASAPPRPQRSYGGEARRAAAHVMRSFLAEHNIRWGELVAGLLIVVCSVGLVVSLWNTLEQTHRLLPSLVFMLGTAGVEGAGLYTLTRWRLRTTSRAMLVIASLLVPLNVVAGIALARSGETPLSLTDPITAVTVMLSAAAYGMLMWWAGRAVLGVSPWRWVVAIVGPAVTLLFFPMWIVDFGADAGWAAGLPALCVIGALMTERRGTARVGSGRAARTITLALGAVYAAGVAVVFLGLQIHHLPGALVSVATAIMPAAIFVAGWACWLHSSAAGRSATWVRLVAASTALLCVLVVFGVFPPALAELRYALGWCIVVAVSAILTAFAHRQAALLYPAAAAAALAIVLLVPQVTYAPGWDGAAGFVQRITTGAAGVVWICCAIALAGAGSLATAAWRAAGRVLLRSAVATGGVGIASAALVSLGPQGWSEPIPVYVSWALLGLAAGVALLAAGRRPQITSAASVLVVVFWLSLFRGSEGWPGADVAPWANLIGAAALATLSTLSAALLAGAVLQRRFASGEALSGWRDSRLVAWAVGAGVVALLTSAWLVIAAWQLGPVPRYAAMYWSVIAAWGVALGVVRRSVPALVAGQLAALVALLVLGLAQSWWTLLPEAWSSGPAVWQMVAVVLLHAVAWAGIRRVLPRGPYHAQANGWGMLGDQSLGCIALAGGTFAAASSMVTAVRHSLHWFSGEPSYALPAVHPPLPPAGWLLTSIGAGGLWILLTCLDRGTPATEAGEATRDGEPTEACKAAAVLGLLFAAAMAAITGLVVLEPPWNVAGGAIAAVVASLLLLVGIRSATGQGWMGRQDESALWPICFFNTIGWAGPLVATWSFLVLAPHQDLTHTATAAMAAADGAILLLWAIFGVLLWAWYRCPRTDQLAIGSIAVAAVVGYAGTLGRPDENGIIQWLAVAGMTLWVLATGIPIARRAGLTHALERLGPRRAAHHTPQRSGAAAYQEGRSIDADRDDSLQPIPWMADGPALTACVMAVGVAVVAAKTLLQLPPHNLFSALPGPTASNVGILFWLGSLAGAWVMVLGRIDRSRQLARESLSAWIVAVASGWTALVALRLFAWPDLVIAWGWGLAQLTLAMLVALYPLVRHGAQRDTMRDARSVQRSELTALVLAVAVLAALGYGWAHGVVRALPVSCAVLAVLGCFVLATVGRRESRNRRGLMAALLAGGVTAAAICWPTPAVRWGINEQNLWNALHWVAVVLAASGIYWRAVWFREEDSARRRSEGASGSLPQAHSRLSVDAVVLGIAAIGALLVALVDVAEFVSGSDFAYHFPWRAAGEIALAVMATIAAASAVLRFDRPGQTFAAHLLSVAPLLIVFVWLADIVALSSTAVLAGCGMTLGVASALAAWILPVMLQWVRDLRSADVVSEPTVHDLPWRESVGFWLGLACICLGGAIAAGFAEVDAAVRWCWIGATVASAVAVGRGGAQLPGAVGSRTAAAGLIALAAFAGSIADVGSIGSGSSQLQMLMRGLIAATVLAGAARGVRRGLFLDPALWIEPLRQVTRGCLVAAGIAMMAMLAMEGAQPEAVVAAVPTRAVMGAAIAILALACVALYRAILPISESDGEADSVAAWFASDAGRQTLVHLAQALIVFAWLHVELCRPGWIPNQLRGYWPLVVMGIAFGSAAVMHWAERRGPRVLVNPLRRTAVLLPLVPVLGFWLSADGGDRSLLPWDVPYALLLALVAAYYGALAIWGQHRSWTGGASVIAGNAAIWVVLSEQPGWDFMTHPQLWLIPPAATVLAAAHLERHRMPPAMLAAVRYAATLVIYVSSTADLLVQQIGSSLSGPIVLILLSLAGMAAGVILQVRAFLFLGAAFVLVSVLSMVWHAQRAIDQVWPWWAFGITTGLFLLAALMLVERFRPAVQELAARLNAWER